MAQFALLIPAIATKLGALMTGALAAGGPTVLPGLASAGAAGGGIAGTAAAIGTGLTAAGTIYSGVQRNRASKFMAAQLKAKGEEERAIAQREASKRRREKEGLLSRVRAVAGASGGGVTDPTVTQIMENIEREGEYNALAEMYRGESSKRTLTAEAKVARAEGKGALTASLLDAGGTIYSAIGRRKRFADYMEDYG